MALLITVLIISVLFLLAAVGVLPTFRFSSNLFWNLFLDVLLVLGALAVVLKAWSIVVVLDHLDPKLLISPSRDPIIDTVSTTALALALCGIWGGRKWGAYLVLARLAFTIGVQIFIYHSLDWQLVRNYSGLDNVLADVVGMTMWVLAFNRTWADFR
jgi:hypothetical protein